MDISVKIVPRPREKSEKSEKRSKNKRKFEVKEVEATLLTPPEQKMIVTDVKVEVLDEVLLESNEAIINDENVMNLDENVVNDEIVMNLNENLDVIADKCLEECVVDDSEEKVLEKSDAEEVLGPAVESLCSDLDAVEEKCVEVVDDDVPMEE